MASHVSVFPASLATSGDRKSAGVVAAGWELSQPDGVARDPRKAPQPSALRKLHALRDTISTVGAGNRESFLSSFSLGGAGSNENVVSVRLPAPRGLRNTSASIASSGIWSSVEPSPEDASSAEQWREDNLSEMERWEYEQRFGVFSSELAPRYVADPRTVFRRGGSNEAAASRQLSVLDADLGHTQLEQSARLQYMQMEQERDVQTQGQMQVQMQIQAQAQHMHMMQTQQMPVVVQRILISPHPAARRRTAGFGCTIA
jgi:hypothetical protein